MKKNKVEKAFWDCLLSEWACNAWDVILRTIWLLLFAAAVIGALRLMAWADTGARDIESGSAQPRHSGNINYGKP